MKLSAKTSGTASKNTTLPKTNKEANSQSPRISIASSPATNIMSHKKKSPNIVALVLAGGTGRRVGADCPKQFVEIDDESILLHTLKAFKDHVNHIEVVCQPEWMDYIVEQELMVKDLVVTVSKAGETGFDSLCSGVEGLNVFSDDTLVMVHDAVRPFVSEEIIKRNIEVATQYGNAITSVEIYETLLSAPEGNGVVRSMTRREGMFRAQTPQTFTLGALRHMISEARRLNISNAQSACVLAQQLGYELHLSPGDIRNFKITTPSDLDLYFDLL